MARILSTAQLPGPALSRLKEAGHELLVTGGTREELLAEIPTVDCLICLLSDQINAEVLETGKALKCVSVYAVGYNNVDLKKATELGIIVTNTPDVLTEATADLTLLLMLAVTRRIREGMEMMQANRFQGWAPELLAGRELSALTVGVIGAGRIGEAVIRKTRAFGSRIIYNNRSGPRESLDSLAEFVSLENLIQEADLITIHTPLTNETRQLFNREQLKRMKAGSFLINTSRGEVIDEAALAELLESGHLAGAALDVFQFEPKVTEALTRLPNVILTPHVGSATVETRSAMSDLAVSNLVEVLESGKSKNQVN